MKFLKEEYVDDLLKGKLYMKPLKYYIDLEKNTRVKGQGDKYEANVVMKDVEVKIFVSGTDTLVAEGKASEMSFYSNQRVMSPVFCMYAIDEENLKIIDEDEKKYIVKPSITEVYKKKLIQDFGDNLVFVSAGHFIERVKKVCEENDLHLVFGKVNYEDLSVNSSKRLEMARDVEDSRICFVKSDEFIHQNEFRILLNNRLVEDHFILEIGDISDIVHQMKISDFFEGLEIHLYKR